MFRGSLFFHSFGGDPGATIPLSLPGERRSLADLTSPTAAGGAYEKIFKNFFHEPVQHSIKPEVLVAHRRALHMLFALPTSSPFLNLTGQKTNSYTVATGKRRYRDLLLPAFVFLVIPASPPNLGLVCAFPLPFPPLYAESVVLTFFLTDSFFDFYFRER